MKYAGFCLGASSIALVVLEKNADGNACVVQTLVQEHEGSVVETLQSMMDSSRLSDPCKLAITGRKFRNLLPVATLSEAEAIESASVYLKAAYIGVDTIVSAGAEAFIAYRLDAHGQIIDVFTGNKCASGTGEFFLQQVERMKLGVEEALRTVDMSNPYPVAGRCSVFCKSDCTHALNKGEAKAKVIGGLCRMMAEKISELLRRGRSRKVLLIGGTSQNQAMVDFVRRGSAKGMEILVPEEARYFEALGAALWAVEHGSRWIDDSEFVQKAGNHVSFEALQALGGFAGLVEFKTMERGTAVKDDECIVGLDVGSTTTKAVIMRASDNALLASVYLRTNGDPVKAARECYAALTEQILIPVRIVGLGATGSGRQIAGIHAGTEGIINEIIAHAAAAAYFDPTVDTIFEIGGQDAKYTLIMNRVPVDYAMNEACSAGTGSFLEESAKETLHIEMVDIADIAMKSNRPLNFNDQCAAFISSDIKTAIQEGVPQDDIVAGLIYSVCQNYVNRVKGNRPVGEKLFMQGGVCYNRAVPIAMAALTGKNIVVPPEPGLMGAYGTALEIREKLFLGLMQKREFNLLELTGRTVGYGDPFVCAGGAEGCDRKCSIRKIRVGSTELPFGGACDRYVNLRRKVKVNIEELDWVRIREQLIFHRYAQIRQSNLVQFPQRIGILRSLVVNTLYPLFHQFFTALGCEVVLADQPNSEGMEHTGATFCYPVELAHCFMADMLKRDTDWIFLPHVVGLRVENGIPASVNCPLLQAEPYYLKTAFTALKDRRILSPTLDFSDGYDSVEGEFLDMAKLLGFDRNLSKKAWQTAVLGQKECSREMKEFGRNILTELRTHPDKIGVVLFGRSYSAFDKNANMGIPNKLASRGKLVIPWDFLPFEEEDPIPNMFWSVGQMMLKTARFVERHPQLFSVYVTNFSCGPDSFVLGYFREIMGLKPSLILELDSHSADAGIDTRVEAFLDVVKSYRESRMNRVESPLKKEFLQSRLVTMDDQTYIIDSHGKRREMTAPDVHLRVVSMGRIQTRFLAAAFRHIGIKTDYLEPAGRRELNWGRAHSNCKECLPYVLVAGSIMEDIMKQRTSRLQGNELLLYFVPDSSGPCRFGQYHVAIQALLKKKEISNVALLSMTSDNGYAGFGTRFQNQAWQSIIISDVMADIYSALLVLAQNREKAMEIFDSAIEVLETAIGEGASGRHLLDALHEQAQKLATIPLRGNYRDTPKVALLGEIFVRTDNFSRQGLVERLADKGILVQVAPVSEFMTYCDYLLQKSLYHVRTTPVDRMMSVVRSYVKRQYEKNIKKALAASGLYEVRMIEIDRMVEDVKHLIPPHYTAGETVLTVASTITDILDQVSGVISIGPFGCMPSRVSEAVLAERLSEEKLRLSLEKPWVARIISKHPSLPFLSLESDGNPFPQIIEAKLELFCLRVLRVHETSKSLK